MLSRTLSRVVTIVLALTLSASAAVASQGRANGQDKKAAKAPAAKADVKDVKHKDKADHQAKGQKAKDHDKNADVAAVAVDRDGHARIIRDYAHAGSLPPGLAKRESLPPGLRKQLRERGELPPGLQKRWVAVPGPWIARLPPVPTYYQRYFAGDDLIVVDTRTNRIAAIIRDVL